MSENTNPLRSLLFVPGNNPDRFPKACASGADAFCIDLEDAVPAAEKQVARTAALKYMGKHGVSTPACYLRINSLATSHGLEDLLALAVVSQKGALPMGIIVPMVTSAFEIRQILQLLNYHPQIRIIPMIETPQGLDNLSEILTEGGAFLEAIAFGCADYAASLGCEMSWDAMLLARSMLVKVASTHAVPCLDGPYFDVSDLDSLKEEAERVAGLGFSGKLAIHPGQVEVINAVFLPSRERIRWARGVIAAFEQAGGGAISFEGMMIDQPVVDQAKRILASDRP